MLALGLVLAGFALTAIPVAPASAAPTGTTIDQCNGVPGVGAGTGAVECNVTVTNNLDLATGVASSTVSTVVCVHEANTKVDCGPATVAPYTNLVLHVAQCNGSINVGGGNVLCTVTIVNNITGSATPTPATVNQCIESGTGGGTEPTTDCDPTGPTTGATVDQCNSSGNGGGATMRVLCTVDPLSSVVPEIPVTVTQCNGSGNNGGSTVICDTELTTIVRAAATTPTATPTPTATASPMVAPLVEAAPQLAATGFSSGPLLISTASALLLGGLVVLFVFRRNIRRPGRQG
ncbi:hypothetical protein [Cryobacterium sp. TMT4-10]|uniref:hypothetical protein n=1 Tax=Cryobacterium sp. TMT4-10 TaxID=1259256 RepID=UPI00106BF84B|nr:hypothetical protein [Cryobacterium sp. TMT4-10]TFD20557.1 hypothetical protein E3T42_02105 [Cryobacterium sp. TMT4-10]